MGLWSWLRGRQPGRTVEELARRLGVDEATLRSLKPAYREFMVPKRSGGTRRLLEPVEPLKELQTTIHKRLLRRLKCHACATGFERGHSIVTHAEIHVGKAVVVRMDLKDFFGSTRARRIEAYFRRIGWSREASRLITQLCTYKGSLPQGAPTSPRLSNLVNYRMDTRMERLALHFGAAYSRYADDLTFSLDDDHHKHVAKLIRSIRWIAEREGYEAHRRKKLQIRRRHQRQQVTGLVVNERVNLPRSTRRRLRAIEHHIRTGRPATMTPIQLAGWQSLRSMIASRSSAGS